MNNTKKMPDAYAKNTESNLYKLLQLVNLLQNDARIDLKCIDKSRDIYNSSGKTLDKYGEMVGEPRNGVTDEQYRTKILSRIARLITGSDYYSVKSAIAMIFGVDSSDISLSEGDMSVTVNGLTIEMLENSGYKSREIEKMISGLIPAGVELVSTKYAGTMKLLSDEEIEKYSYMSDNNPVLVAAWAANFTGLGKNLVALDVGLSGYGEIPDEWKKKSWGLFFPANGTFNGGTLGMLSGEDE